MLTGNFSYIGVHIPLLSQTCMCTLYYTIYIKADSIGYVSIFKRVFGNIKWPRSLTRRLTLYRTWNYRHSNMTHEMLRLECVSIILSLRNDILVLIYYFSVDLQHDHNWKRPWVTGPCFSYNIQTCTSMHKLSFGAPRIKVKKTCDGSRDCWRD